ncbi:MAG: phthalate 4,5-dioxygenase [Betaproteobacteria bacterium]|nr:phthalate 4,5-dioxygenase [Betaproteobacteria bacterium]
MPKKTAKAARLAELPVHTGPGTAGGDLLRRYWQPIALCSDVVEGGAPLPLKIMSEDLVLFRGGDGRVGLLGLHCSHRQADLSYGRVEDGGLRCVYHGWVFDVNGRCLQQPAEPVGGAHRDRVKHLSYPCLECGGAIWTYMGPGEAPLFPAYPAINAPEEYRFTYRWHSNCNYLQANEGNIDPIHTSYLHAFQTEEEARHDALRTGITQDIFGLDTAPRLSVRDARWGLRLLTERRIPESGKILLRVTNFVMPNGCAIGGAETPFGAGGASMFFHVPIDDTSHYRMEFTFHSKAALPRAVMAARYHDEVDERGLPKRKPENRYLQNREEMKRSYLGMGRNFPSHDLFVTESQGAIMDRDAENLVSSDLAIVRSRRLLAEAMEAVRAGRDPLGVDRDKSKNDYRDLLVLTETIEADADVDAYIRSMQERDIYQLDRERVVAQKAQAPAV